MKKFMAIMLAMMLVLGLMPSALAANANEGSVVFDSIESKVYTIGSFEFYGSASNSTNSTLTLENGKFTIVSNATKKSEYSQIGVFSSNPSKSGLNFSNGSIEISQKIIFSNPEHSRFRPEVKVKNVSNYNVVYSGGIYIMDEGYFFDGETEVLADTEYLVAMTLNTDTNTMTWNVKNEALGVDISKDTVYSGELGQSFDCPREIKFCYESDEAPTTFNVSDFTVTTKELNFAHIKKLLYVNGDSEVKITDGDLVPLDATAVKAEFSGAINKNGTVATLKKVVGDEEVTVSASETFYNKYYANDGYVPYITVAPANGFEPGATYKLYLSNLTDPVFGVPMPEGGLVKTFAVADTIDFRGIKDGDIITTTSATLLAYVPYPENGVKFVLDGKELTPVAGEGNVYSASVEGMANGLHRFTVTSGEESKTITFTSAHVPNYWDIMANYENNLSGLTATKCAGADGEEDGAIELSGAKGAIVIRHPSSMSYTDNRSVWFEADVRRIGNAGIQISGYISGGYYPVLAGGDLIKRNPDGGIAGSSYVIAQNDPQWHNIRVIQQMKNENSEYLVYLDGELIHRGTETGWTAYTGKTVANSRFTLSAYSSPIQIDNAKYGEMVSPVFIGAAYKEDAAAAEFTPATDGVISGVSKAIKITQLNNPLTLEGVAVTVNGVAATAVIDSADANSLIVTPAEGSISANEDVVIKVGNYVTVLKADGDTYDNMGELTLSVDGDSAVAKIKIAKANVGDSAMGDSVLLMIASYDSNENRLKAVNLVETTLLSGAHEYSAPLTSLNGGVKVKAMLWQSSSSAAPVMESVQWPEITE